MSQLLWPPIHNALDDRARLGDRLNWVVVPFVKLAALERLFESTSPAKGFKLICRWRPGDFIAGVSDLSVFHFLQERGCQLFVNRQIHMKLYVFESNIALSTSGNLTLRGLGYVDPSQANIEVGSTVELNASDWVNLYRVIAGSRLVTQEIYDRFEAFVKAQPSPPSIPEVPDLLGPAKKYTLTSLPAADSPEDLAKFYFDPAAYQHSTEIARRAFHDLATFEISPGLSRAEFEAVLGESFRKNPFVIDFVALLREQGSLHFGAVNAWIHQKCEDVPLPYKWEIKSSTHSFYNWLAHYIPEVTWDRPNHSQVVYWDRAKS